MIQPAEGTGCAPTWEGLEGNDANDGHRDPDKPMTLVFAVISTYTHF